MSRFSNVLDEKQLSRFLEECEDWQVSSSHGSPSDKQIADEQLTTLASYAIPELVDEVRNLRKFKAYVHQRLDDAGVNPHDEQNAINGCRIGSRLDDVLQPYTEASTQDALAILDRALTLESSRSDEWYLMIEEAANMLRPVPKKSE
ncbi:hypothetical protein SAMN06265337_0656 [Hymenobacter gelipurpurascens]|uniref:Uncharacterized protein n=1 Tax=Hymenobacter gelipurpurascens TaxID=89968 RepID=A0A212T8M4_9BACT|nr:hypothetical protein [Hymenobacter gelipurpurascens]SNC62369.1 hypothetical protein SAMN06265337_0656 [Hymenobacter gelipurpurascens]